MNQVLRLLILEDNANDAELIVRALRKSEFDVVFDRVETKQDFVANLNPALDLIISDYQLPGFTGIEALEITKSTALEVPFVLVSGTVGEDIAVEAMRQGASDYVMKDRLTRLGESVRRALEQRRLREDRTIADRALQRSRDRFSAFFELDLIGMAISDAHARFIEANPQFCFITGYTRDELMQKTWEDLATPQDRDSFKLELEKLYASTLNEIKLEKNFIRKDEFVIRAQICLRCVRMQTGEIDYILALFQDVTETRDTEEQVRKASERFQQVVETIEEVFWMRSLEKDALIYVSPGYEKVWGRSPSSIYQNPREWLETIHPKDQRRVLEATPGQVEGNYDIEYQIIRPDGEIRWIHDRAYPVKDSSGNVYRVVGVAADITSRKHFENALIERDRQLQESQTVAAVGSWAFEVETGKVTWSEEEFRLLGLEPGKVEPTFELFLSFLPQEDQIRFQEINKRATQLGEPFILDHRIVRADGLVRRIQTRGQVQQNSSGKIVRLRGTTQDITDRYQLESQLQQAQKMEAIGRLSGGVAHDFNNLLTVILGHVGVLDTCEMEPDAVESAEEIKKAAKRAAALTSQLLLFARKQTMQMRRIDLELTISDTGKMLSRILGEDIHLEVKCHEKVFIDGDPTMLDQVLLNLAVNARDAMPNGGTLIIETRSVEFDRETAAMSTQVKPGRFARLSVRDTGTGIKPDILPKIFDPFFTTKSVGKGTGLGLSTAFAIVQQHGGWINVYSEAEMGTVFSIYLPLSRDEEAAPAEATHAVSFTGGTETVLVVEDEPAIRDMIVKYLTRLAYTVLSAENGQIALELWNNRMDQIQLVLTDMVMPGGISGVQLADKISADKPAIPIVYMSGYSEFVGSKKLDLKEGVNFLPKPFALPQVAQTIRARLDSK